MQERRRLYTSVAALVRKLRSPKERVWNWSEYEPGEVTVLLFDERISKRVERLVQQFGGGGGRSLHFQKVGRRWTLAGHGVWRT